MSDADARMVLVMGCIMSIKAGEVLRDAGYAIEELGEKAQKISETGVELHLLENIYNKPAAEFKYNQSWQSINKGKLSKKERRK